MEARLSCWLLVESVNIIAKPGGPVAGFHDLITPICSFYIVIWMLLCKYIMWLLEFVEFVCAHNLYACII